jgi:hypothetical protein
VNWSALSSTPPATRVISSGLNGGVVGLTLVENRLFVLRTPSRQLIEAYDAKTFRLERRKLDVEGLSDNVADSGLTSCGTNKCLYVSDYVKDTIFKVGVGGDTGVFNWSVDGTPKGLSVNNARHLIVSCAGDKVIKEYTTDGDLVREIPLPWSPRHAVQLSGGDFIVSCEMMQGWSRTWSVVEVDSTGCELVKNYVSHLQPVARPTLNLPRHLASDRNNEFVLVADMNNRRILILNRQLNGFAGELDVKSVNGGLSSPSCLHFDETRGRLFIGEKDGQHRIILAYWTT